MSTSPVSGSDPASVAQEVTVRLAKQSQDVQKQQGEDAVALIQSASPPASSPDGKGQLLNTYA
jgi:hypothetical protein